MIDAGESAASADRPSVELKQGLSVGAVWLVWQVEDLSTHGLHYITAITKPQIEALLSQEILTMSLFDQSLAEVQTDEGHAISCGVIRCGRTSCGRRPSC